MVHIVGRPLTPADFQVASAHGVHESTLLAPAPAPAQTPTPAPTPATALDIDAADTEGTGGVSVVLTVEMPAALAFTAIFDKSTEDLPDRGWARLLRRREAILDGVAHGEAKDLMLTPHYRLPSLLREERPTGQTVLGRRTV